MLALDNPGETDVTCQDQLQTTVIGLIPMDAPSVDFQILFDLISAPCAVLDRNLCFVEANQLYLQTLMRNRRELLGRNILDAFPEEPERQKLIENAFRSTLQGKATYLQEIPCAISNPDEARDGMQEVWWTIHCTPIPDKGGNIDLIGLRVEDVTSGVQARQIKDTITGELQHRIGNLLTLVSTVARRTANDVDDVEDFLERFNGRIQA